jgi:ankyrin repeat protein
LRIFQGTPVSKVVCLLDKNEFEEAQQILSNTDGLINYQEPKFRFTLSHWAVFARKLPQFTFLLEHGANVHIRDDDGIDITTRAADIRDTDEYLKLTLEHGGDVNSYSVANQSIMEGTPLIAAIRSKNLSNVILLLEKGADPNLFWYYPNGKFDAPLGLANGNNSFEIAEHLLRSGKCDLQKPVYQLPPEMREIYIVEDLERRLVWTKTKADSLSIQNLISIAQAQLDSLKK